MVRTEALSARVAARLTTVREDLMGGRGPGASTAEVLAVTRNRVQVAGLTATRRLELTARQTSRARGDAAAVLTAVQLREAEVLCGVEETTSRLPHRGLQPSQNRSGEKSAVIKVLALVAVRVLRRHGYRN